MRTGYSTSAILVTALLLGGNAPTSVAVEPIRPLAQDHVVVYRSPSPSSVFAYSPGIIRLKSGRLVVSMDIGGPGVKSMPGPRHVRKDNNKALQGKIFTSDDRGKTWTHRADLAMFHMTIFVAGNSVYALGHGEDLLITRSDDDGQTWSKPAPLTQGELWTGHARGVVYANGCVYTVMEKKLPWDKRTWQVANVAPTLMRGRLDEDLTQAANWTFASPFEFRSHVKAEQVGAVGVPFFAEGTTRSPGRHMAPIGWAESNVVQFQDPDHLWFDPTGRTFHLWMRAHTGGTQLAAIAQVVEQGEKPGTGAMKTQFVTAPSGKRMVYVPCPGGQMKFNIMYDSKTKLYWLLSTQATDSMTRPERLPGNRYGLPNNERQRLQLHFSRNCVDWCFAGIVARGEQQHQARHYATMVIDGDDLHVVSRSGDAHAKSAHDGNLITFHTIPNFRSLVY